MLNCTRYLFFTLLFVSTANAANDYIVAPSGGDITGAALSAKLATADVTLKSSAGANAGSGNIIINDVVEWSENYTLTLTASNDVKIKDKITATGATAGMLINPNTANTTGTNVEAASGSGVYALSSSITLSGATPSLSIGGTSFYVLNSLGKAADSAHAPTTPTLQGVAANGNLANSYALGTDIDASSASSWHGGEGFTPIGMPTLGAYTGTFDGLGHVIKNLPINKPAPATGRGRIGSRVGFFAQLGSGGIVRNVGLVNASIQTQPDRGGWNTVGGLVAYNMAGGTIQNSFFTGTVATSYNGGYVTGGFVGENYGTIESSFLIGNVSDQGGAKFVSGFVTLNAGSGIIKSCYANVNVSGFGPLGTAALVGGNSGKIESSYAIGSLAINGYPVTPFGHYGGGLVGYNCSVGDTSTSALCPFTNTTGTVTNSYALVTSDEDAPAVVGTNQGTMTSVYWNTDLVSNGVAKNTGTMTGVKGLSTLEMQDHRSFFGFDFATPKWIILDSDGTVNNLGGVSGVTFPILASEYSTRIVTPHQLQLMLLNKSASYTLNNDIDLSGTGGTGDVWPITGFVPIGGYAKLFTGSFDGQSNSIKNLSSNQNTIGRVGLFGYLGSSANVKNLTLDKGSVTGNNGGNIGSLAGINDGTVTSVNSSANVTGAKGGVVGGLIGGNNGTITSSGASGTIGGVNGLRGGFVGANTGTMSSCTVTSTVTGHGGFTGAIVAENMGTNNCSSS